MSTFTELKDYLQEKYVNNHARYQRLEYFVGKERYEVTLYCNDKTAKIHAENLGLTLC